MVKHGLLRHKGNHNTHYRHNLPACYSYGARRHIGLLGGSFNPAHSGHIALSQKARIFGHCDQIWWLVSPQNPLKSTKDMADYDSRLAYARAFVSSHHWIKVLSLEIQSGSNYSYDTCLFLQKRSPHTRFTWLMGTDNLCQLPRWYRARAFAKQMPCLVFRRKDSFYPALASQGRRYFAKGGQLRFDPHFNDTQSATALRENGFWQR